MTLKLNRRHFLSTATAGAVAASLPLSARAATALTMQAAWINDAEFAGYFPWYRRRILLQMRDLI